MDIAITKEFTRAVWDASDALAQRASELERTPEYPADNSVGSILRHNVELSRQQVALLRDWVRRAEDKLRTDNGQVSATGATNA